jgi:hypothetical protein
VSSITSSSVNTFSPQSRHQYLNVAASNHSQLVTNNVAAAARSTGSTAAYSSSPGKHKLPFQLSRPPPPAAAPSTNSIGVSVITPAATVSHLSHKREMHYKPPQHQHMVRSEPFADPSPLRSAVFLIIVFFVYSKKYRPSGAEVKDLVETTLTRIPRKWRRLLRPEELASRLRR